MPALVRRGREEGGLGCWFGKAGPQHNQKLSRESTCSSTCPIVKERSSSLALLDYCGFDVHSVLTPVPLASKMASPVEAVIVGNRDEEPH